MTPMLEKKLKKLPKTPGVYFFKNAEREIIYIGKAARLSNRVRQYFQNGRPLDTKTQLLVNEIADIDWIEVESEIDALFLEAEQVRRNLPRYNILLRDDKAYVYVRIDFNSSYPSVTITRRPLDDKAKYFGPFSSALAVRKALKYLRRAFPFSTHIGVIPKRACLQAHLGLCPGLEENLMTQKEYKANLNKLSKYLSGKKQALVRQIEKDMKRAAKAKQYEQAAKLRDQLNVLKRLEQQVVFGDREFLDISKDHALRELAELLSLKQPPKRIEGFDISHMSGTDTTASMVVFSFGLPDKTQHRKFKMRVPGNDDFAHMFEVISRRLSERNLKQWGRPDLILIDGGNGQVNAALKAQAKLGVEIPTIGLAKRFETIILPRKQETGNKKRIDNNDPIKHSHDQIATKSQFVSAEINKVELPKSSHLVKLLQRIRDESHRFAVSYHSTLKTKRQTASLLDEIPGIGPVTRKKLVRHFGSLKAVLAANPSEIAKIIGTRKANSLKDYN